MLQGDTLLNFVFIGMFLPHIKHSLLYTMNSIHSKPHEILLQIKRVCACLGFHRLCGLRNESETTKCNNTSILNK